MTPAMQRFDQLCRIYLAAIPPSNNISRKRRAAIGHAAEISILLETMLAEIRLGVRAADPTAVERMLHQANQHLVAAHSQITLTMERGRLSYAG